MRAVLARPGFRAFFVADVLSQLGTQALRVALPLTAIAALGASDVQVGLLAACTTVAIPLLGLPIGALVDRVRRRPVLIGCDLARVAVLVTVPVAAWAGVLSMPQLYVVALAVGALSVGFDTAHQSYLPRLVDRDQLLPANALHDAVFSGGQIAGRALGGLLVQAVSGPVAVLAGAVGYGWSALWLTRIRDAEPVPERVAGRRLRTEIAEGLRFVLGHPVLRLMAVSVATLNTALLMLSTVLLLYLTRDLGLGGAAVGAVLAAGGVGALAGASLVTRAGSRFGPGPVLIGSILLTMPTTFLLPALSSPWLIGVQQAVLWAGVIANSTTQVSLRQQLTPDRLLGRMNATMRTLIWAFTPLGAILGGVLSAATGPRTALLVVAAGLTASAGWLFAAPVRTLRAVPAP